MSGIRKVARNCQHVLRQHYSQPARKDDMSVKRRHTLNTEHGQEAFPKTLHRKDTSQTGTDANASTITDIAKAPDARRRGADSLPSLC